MEHRMLKMKGAKIREDGGKKYLDGYFAVFNQEYHVFDGWIETIAPGAFARYLASGGQTKVLWNHNSDIVLGSTGNRTATLSEDSTGLFGSVELNEMDQDAINAFARVSRGDVDGCSFGFDIGRYEEWWDENGIYHTRITEVDPLYEVSPCTFPAYAGTSISARDRQEADALRERFERAKLRRSETWKAEMKRKLKGE